MKKTFNPQDWVQDPNPAPVAPVPAGNSAATSNSPAAEEALLEKTLQALESARVDISGDYATWVEIAFAICSVYRESGRSYFHRVSQFHPEYDTKECDRQYDHCLRSKGSGIGIGTFYHHVKRAGISLSRVESENSAAPFGPGDWEGIPGPVPPEPPEPAGYGYKGSAKDDDREEEPEEEMPVFPESVYEQLPEFLQKIIAPAGSSEERDILLLGSLTTLSACFPTLYGIYDSKKIHANLYLFVTARASAGKGRLSLCRQLVLPVHNKLREKTRLLKMEYAVQLSEYNNSKSDGLEKPAPPPEQMLFIPANNSTTGVFQLIGDNKGQGLIFETEGDTLAQSFRSDHGNYSDGFRKAFHHETISYYRRTDREYVDITHPCLSTVLSGTPRQIATLIPNAENGLFSRFLFYYMNLKATWKDVFAEANQDGIEEYFKDLGAEFLVLHESLKSQPGIRIALTEEQQQKFNAFFSRTQHKYLNVQSADYVATVRRMGVICFRMIMLFSALRIMEDGDVSVIRHCEDRDFNTVMEMITVLVKHSSKVYSNLPLETKIPKRNNRKEKLLEALPKEFSRVHYMQAANNLKISPRTAEKYITDFVRSALVLRNRQNHYVNTNWTE